MNAEALIADVMLAYRLATAYRDVGTVTQYLHLATVRVRFETQYERGEVFSFAFSDGFTRGSELEFAVCSDSSGVRVKDPDRPGRTAKSLDDILSAFTGISFGSAWMIPRLLMPSRISGRILFELGGDHRLGVTETIDGKLHDVIEMRERSTLWRVLVARETKTIRRIERRFGEILESVHDYDAVLTP